MIRQCSVFYDNDKPDYCIITIPGRGNDGTQFARLYQMEAEFNNTVFVGPTPHGFAWYPLPTSATDQDRALAGLPRARDAINAVVDAVQRRFSIPKSKIVLAGFSAGGVMAIETAAHSNEPFAAVVCHSGAILEPKNLPECKHPKMPVILTHCKDDDCFEWFERYVPMKEALFLNGYDTYALESRKGNHRILDEAFAETVFYLAQNVIPQPKKWFKKYRQFKPLLEHVDDIDIDDREINYLSSTEIDERFLH